MRAWGALVLVMATAFATSTGCGSNGKSSGGGGSGGGTTGGIIGDACKATSDCESGMSFFCSVDDPGGQCLKLCNTASDCPSGSTCTDEKKCYKSCASQTDCTRSPYQCVNATTVDMKGTKTCDVPGEVGDGCLAMTDCDTTKKLFCSQDDPGGQCLAICAKQSDCPAGSTCTDEKKCYLTCKTNADCVRTGYACVDSMTVDNMPSKTCDVAGG